MNKNTIITIGRQYGSGGREIGQMLAERQMCIRDRVKATDDSLRRTRCSALSTALVVR